MHAPISSSKWVDWLGCESDGAPSLFTITESVRDFFVRRGSLRYQEVVNLLEGLVPTETLEEERGGIEGRSDEVALTVGHGPQW